MLLDSKVLKNNRMVFEVIVLKNWIRYIISAHKTYNGTSMMMALFFVALFFIVFLGKDKRIKDSVKLPILFLQIFNFILVPFSNAATTYIPYYDGRFFWVMLTPAFIAVGFTIIISEIEDTHKRILALLLIVPICLLCGEFKLNNKMYQKVQNDYRLPQYAVEITDKILSEKQEPLILVPYTIAHPFRQISTDVKLLFGEDATSVPRIGPTKKEYVRVCNEMEKTTPDINYVVDIARENSVDYIVFDTVYTELCEDGNINIYGYPQNENYVGDRTPTVSFDDLKDIKVIDDERGIYWDLSEYGLDYDGTYGQYILYKFLK